MIYVLIIAVQLILFTILFLFLLYFLSMIISDLFGVPFVPTRGKSVEQILAQIKFKRHDVFYDLGCGDGRLVFYVARHYKIRAVGVELNPLLYFFSQLKKKFTRNHRVSFYRRNFFDVDLRQSTVIYLFLFPEVVEKLKAKILKECRHGTIIISHGFKAKYLEARKFKELTEKPFATYYYRL